MQKRTKNFNSRFSQTRSTVSPASSPFGFVEMHSGGSEQGPPPFAFGGDTANPAILRRLGLRVKRGGAGASPRAGRTRQRAHNIRVLLPVREIGNIQFDFCLGILPRPLQRIFGVLAADYLIGEQGYSLNQSAVILGIGPGKLCRWRQEVERLAGAAGEECTGSMCVESSPAAPVLERRGL